MEMLDQITDLRVTDGKIEDILNSDMISSFTLFFFHMKQKRVSGERYSCCFALLLQQILFYTLNNLLCSGILFYRFFFRCNIKIIIITFFT